MPSVESRNLESLDEAGDVYRIAPGHDAWVVGEQPAVLVEFRGAANCAKA